MLATDVHILSDNADDGEESRKGVSGKFSFTVHDGTMPGDMILVFMGDGTECLVKCPKNARPGDSYDQSSLVWVKNYGILEEKEVNYFNSKYFKMPSRCISKTWIVAEFILLILLCTIAAMENWTTINFTEDCLNQSEKYFTSRLYVSFFHGIGSAYGCENFGVDFCIRFSDTWVWNRIDSITGARMAYSSTYSWATAQFLIPLSLGICALTIFIHALLLTILDHTKNSALAIQFTGGLTLLLCGSLLLASYVFSNSSDLVNPKIWEKFISSGITFEEILNEDLPLNLTASYPTESPGYLPTTCNVSLVPEGSALLETMIFYAFLLVFAVFTNGCGGLMCCGVCVEEDGEGEKEDDDENSEDCIAGLSADDSSMLYRRPYSRR